VLSCPPVTCIHSSRSSAPWRELTTLSATHHVPLKQEALLKQRDQALLDQLCAMSISSSKGGRRRAREEDEDEVFASRTRACTADFEDEGETIVYRSLGMDLSEESSAEIETRQLKQQLQLLSQMVKCLNNTGQDGCILASAMGELANLDSQLTRVC